MSKATKTDKSEQRVHGLPMGPQVKAVLHLAYRARRAALLEGPTGIGKSQLIAELAQELGIDHLVLDLSLLEPPDLVGLPMMIEGRTVYAPPAILPTSGAGILLLEELNRAERFIQQPALQLLTARRLHTYELPPGWVPFAAINPEDGDYQVTPLDPALRARFLNLRVRPDRDAWLEWAKSHSIQPAVLQLARRDPHFLDDIPPRTWAYVSDILGHVSPREWTDRNFLRAALGGYLTPTWIEVLLKELDEFEATDGIDVRQLLRTFDSDLSQQGELAKIVAEGRTDVLEMIAYRLLGIVDSPDLQRVIEKKQFRLEAFEALLQVLPGDHREAVQRAISVNPAAWPLLSTNAEAVLIATYPKSTTAATVYEWQKSQRTHRVAWLVGKVSQAIDQHPNIVKLRVDHGVLAALSAFLKHIGDADRAPLQAALDRKNVTLG